MHLSEAVEKLRQPFQGDPIPLDTEPVPVETGSDTPGFAPDGAGRGQNPRRMSLDFENFNSLCSRRSWYKDFFDTLRQMQEYASVFLFERSFSGKLHDDHNDPCNDQQAAHQQSTLLIALVVMDQLLLRFITELGGLLRDVCFLCYIAVPHAQDLA